jgi:AcrR family transcriptional regulator
MVSRARSASESLNAPQGRSEELVIVAARLFRDRGYDATSMQEIANEMGILKGSLYHYVRTKEDLLWMIVEPAFSALVEDAEAIFADTSGSLTERITRAIESHALRFEENFPHMMVVTRENGETISSARRDEFASLRDRYYRIWKDAVASGIESGELRPELDPSVTVHGIFGMVNWMFRWFVPGRRLNARYIAEQFALIAVSGIASDSGGGATASSAPGAAGSAA